MFVSCCVLCAELLEKLLYARTTPSLALVDDINVVCSCLKSFLRLLDEPMVTFALRAAFIEASKLYQSDPDAAKNRAIGLMKKLPVANRETLAFIILHLKVPVAFAPQLIYSQPPLPSPASFFFFLCVGSVEVACVSNGRC